MAYTPEEEYLYSVGGDNYTDSRLDALQTGSSGDLRYQIGKLSYPEGLGVNPDLQHYVAFYINVRGKSKMVTQGQNTNELFQVANAFSGQNRLSPENAGQAVAKSVGLAGGIATLVNVFTKKGAAAKGAALTKGVLGTGAAVGLVKAAQTTPLLQPDKTYRLKDVITLHVEERPSVKYSANYSNKDLGGLMALLGDGSSTDSTRTGGGVSEFASFATMAAAKVPGALGASGSTANMASSLLQNSAKVTTNPFREVFFEAVDFRTFNFRYRFFPKSQAEADKVQNIIKTFKYHMHPELSASGYFYIYPSEFEIKYFYRDRENSKFQKISTCALTDMQVEYGGDQFSTFRDGSPVEYTLTLTFKELEILHKDRIMEGY